MQNLFKLVQDLNERCRYEVFIGEHRGGGGPPGGILSPHPVVIYENGPPALKNFAAGAKILGF